MSDNSLTIKFKGQSYRASGDLSLSPVDQAGDDTPVNDEPVADQPETSKPAVDTEVGITDMGGPNDLHPHKITVRVGDTIAFHNKAQYKQTRQSGPSGVLDHHNSWSSEVDAIGEGQAKIWCWGAKSGDPTRTMEVTVLPAKDEFAPKRYSVDEVADKTPAEDKDGGSETEPDDDVVDDEKPPKDSKAGDEDRLGITAEAAIVTKENPAPDLKGTVTPAGNQVFVTIKNDDGVTVHRRDSDEAGDWTLPGSVYGGFGSDAVGKFRLSCATYLDNDNDKDGVYAYPEIQVEGTQTPRRGSSKWAEVVLDHSLFFDKDLKLPSQITSLQGLAGDYSPAADRVVPERKPVDVWRNFDLPERDPGNLPTVRVEFDDRESGEQWALDNVPLGVTPIQKADGSDHRNVAVCRHRDCVMLENPWLDSDGEYAGDYRVYVDGELVYSEDEIFLFRWTRTVPVRDGQEQLPFHPIDPAFAPVFDYDLAGSLSDKWYKNAIGNSSVNGLGLIWPTNGNATGAHWYIGPLSAVGSQYVIEPNQKTATAARKEADHLCAWGIYVRDRATKRPMKITDHPKFSADYRHLNDPGNEAVDYPDMVDTIPERSTHSYNTAHSPAIGFAAALATGSEFDRENIEFKGNYAAGAMYIAGYRGYEKGYVQDNQVRTLAWMLRDLTYGALICHDDMREYFDQIMRNNEQRQRDRYGPNGKHWNPLHMKPTSVWSAGHDNYMGAAGWEMDYLSAVYGLMVRLGYTDFSDMRDFMCTNQVQRSNEICYQFATLYSFRCKTERDGPLSVDNWTDAFRLDHRHMDADSVGYGQVCGTFNMYDDGGDVKLKTGDMGGYPHAPGGYPAWYMGAYTSAVDAQLNGAREGYDAIMANRATQPTFDEEPMFALVPEADANFPVRDYSVTFMHDPACHVNGRRSNDRDVKTK